MTTRVVMWLALPVFVFVLALLYTMIQHWTQGVSFCDSWLSGALPLCR